MREFQFLPEIEGSEISGYVKIKILPYLERAKLVKELNVKEMTDELDLDKGFDLVEKMYKIAKDNHLEINLVRDGLEFKSFEDLEYDEDGTKIIQEIAKKVINGVRLSKK